MRAVLSRLVEIRAARGLSPNEEARYLALGRREAELLTRLG